MTTADHPGSRKPPTAGEVPGPRRPAPAWSRSDIDRIVAAARQAPSVHHTEPWVLDVHGHSVAVYEGSGDPLFAHDPLGRDRRISCGAVLANVVLAVRLLGWAVDSAVAPDSARPDLAGTATATDPRPASPVERAMAEAIPRRRSHRRRFADREVPDSVLDPVLAAAAAPGVAVRPVTGAAATRALAGGFEYAGRVFRRDRTYHRELAAWTVAAGEEESRGGKGIPVDALGEGALPWTGLARRGTPQPDAEVLARRIQAERVLLVQTPGDERPDAVRAGLAVQRAWLAAVSHGLVGAVLTQPLQLTEVRHRLARAFGGDHPQILLRLGYPRTDRPPSSDS